MLTSGELLKQKREEKGLTLEQVEKATRIRKKYLIAVEAGDLDNLPGRTYVRGFIKNYARYLNLPVENVLAILRREYDVKMKKEIVPKGLANPLFLPGNFFHKFTIPITFVIALVVFGFYLYYQYRSFGSLPQIIVDFPPDNYISRSEKIEIKGRTDHENRLFINGQEISVENDGTFTLDIKLNKGDNTLIIAALNRLNRENKIEKNIKGDF